MTFKHLMYVPFTGLGLYGGSRGTTWLKNRIEIFKRFVVPSLQAQTNQNFDIWISWRAQEKESPLVKELEQYLLNRFPKRVVFTYSGVCFWDDKYKPEEARIRLMKSLRGMSYEMVNYTDADNIIMTIQPSDDCYRNTAVQEIQNILNGTNGIQATGYRKGYIMDYTTGEVRYYNPLTIPPFFSILFTKTVFVDPFKHFKYTGPYESHEYIAKNLKFLDIHERGFLVGTHGENISTHFKHPFAGDSVDKTILDSFGIMGVQPIAVTGAWHRRLLRKLPHRVQRKLRYIIGEKIYQKIYNIIHVQ